jgi:hypothetical protein
MRPASVTSVPSGRESSGKAAAILARIPTLPFDFAVVESAGFHVSGQELRGWSTTRIGRFYNLRHHAAVLHAMTKSRVRQMHQSIDASMEAIIAEFGPGRKALSHGSFSLVGRPSRSLAVGRTKSGGDSWLYN